MALREEVLRRDGPGGDYPDPDGEYMDTIDAKGDRIVVLTRVADSEASSTDDAADDDSDYPTTDEGDPLCVGKDDGQCSRTVDAPGGVCWQHED
jgi:hypothetical protein